MSRPADLAVRSVSLVVEGLVHDLNNPLTILLANLEMVTRRVRNGVDLDADDVDALEECQQASQRIATLLRDARVLSRTSGAARVDVVLAAALRATKQAARDCRVRPAIEAAIDPDLVVATDEPRCALAVTLLVDTLLKTAPAPHDDDVADGPLTRPGDVATVTLDARADGAGVVLLVKVGGALALEALSPPDLVEAEALVADCGGVLVVDRAAGTIGFRLPRHVTASTTAAQDRTPP